MSYNIINYFKEHGMINPIRSINLINRAIEFNKLDLEGLTIFTEAASGEYIYTPIIAAMAGAKKVYAIAKDSIYANKDEVKKDTMLFAELCGVKEKIFVVFDKCDIGEADIVTNLGFVRPIDKETIDMMKSKAVISYMCEAWEVRREDVDIDYCKGKSINVMGTNENYLGLDVFNFSGPLALKMLFEAGIEGYKSKIVILSKDNFGTVIYNTLSKLIDDVSLIEDLNQENYKILKNADALLVADYKSDKCFIGKSKSCITAKELRTLSEFIMVIQFAGIVDIEDLIQNNISFYPNYKVGSFRMGKTLADLGARPVIDLHCAGLKVGEIMLKSKGKQVDNELCQEIY